MLIALDPTAAALSAALQIEGEGKPGLPRTLYGSRFEHVDAIDGAGAPGRFARIDHDRRQIVVGELPQLDEQHAAGAAERRMAAAGRVADIGACRIVAMLVLEGALQHDEFLAPAMGMGGKGAARRIADDGGGTRHLIPDPVQHPAIDTLHGRSLPGLLFRVHNDAFREICIQFHVTAPVLWSSDMARASDGHKLRACTAAS